MSPRLVGNTGFEPVISCTQDKRDSQTTPIPEDWCRRVELNRLPAVYKTAALPEWATPAYGTPWGTRTHDPLIKS